MGRTALFLASVVVLATQPGLSRAACITLYDAAQAPDCTALMPVDAWTPALPAPGEILLFKNLWGKGKQKSGKPFVGPKRAGVGLAGPVCWTGTNPELFLEPSLPLDDQQAPWQEPKGVDWQAVKRGGFCQICCTGVF